MRRRCLAAPITAALLIGACGSPDGVGAEPEGESLDDFIPGAAAFNDENWEEESRRQELEAQEAIAACMAKEGFEYVPYVPNYDDGSYGGPKTEEEYVQEYALGISYYVLNSEIYGEEAATLEGEEGNAGEGDSSGFGQDTAPSDPGEEGDASDPEDEVEYPEGMPDEFLNNPNRAIREAMPEDEQKVYDEALYGVYPESEFDEMTDEEYEAMSEDELDAMFEDFDARMEGYDPGGCYNEVNAELWSDDGATAFYEQFGDQLEDIHKRAEADPRIAELETEWSKCMSGAGYAFDNEEDAVRLVLGKLEEIDAVSVPANAQSAWEYEPKPVEPGSDTFKEVEAIFKEEVAIAKASVKCREGDAEVYETVHKEYEQAFIDGNRAALEQFRKENG